MEINGSISYAAQDPWIFPATIRQNILFGKEYYDQRYKEVLRVCGLEYDLTHFDRGDLTVLTDKGQNLSKGQQARINLARAIYRDANIYLLDDPLTALDPSVGNYIFNECVLKFLRDKTVLMVTQNFDHIDKSNKAIVLDEGKIVSERKTNEFENILTKNNSQNRYDGVNFGAEECGSGKLYENEQIQIRKPIFSENKKKGFVDFRVFHKYFQYGGGYIIFTLIMLVYVASQYTDSYGDKLLTNW